MPDVSGILKRNKNKSTFTLRDPARSLRPGPNDPVVLPEMIRKFKLVEGAEIVGSTKPGKQRPPQVNWIESICGLKPDEFNKRPNFKDLTAINPNERFDLSLCGDKTMRIVDIVAPIGRGTRGLIVSPPKAGKTTLLKQIANAINIAKPDSKILVLLIDERPEEVTYFKRETNGTQVIASTIDQSVDEHIELAELMLANITLNLECGKDVVVLVDSITRMGRAFNRTDTSRGRTMSGGLGAGAMEIPRKFFGLARNIEHGGSITIISTVLVDTGSRMDQMIFEEFKGTGNSEIILDRRLAEQRVYPAIDLGASGTRREEQLYGPEDAAKIAMIRKVLHGRTDRNVIESFNKMLDKYPTNREFFDSFAAE